MPLPSCTPAGPDTKEPPKQEIEEPDTEDRQDNDKNEISMKMIVGEYTFDVEYVDNNTAEAFKKMLPVTLKMEELNGEVLLHRLLAPDGIKHPRHNQRR